MTILITGFEPFGGATLNPSGLIVEALRDQADERNIVLEILPVEYARASARLVELVEQHEPNAVLCLGQAEGRTAISIETTAYNLDDTNLADNSGELRVAKAIVEGSDAELATSLPVEVLIAAIERVGVAVETSGNPGRFVCNHIFYELQRVTRGTNVASGFIHLPLVAEQSEEFPGRPTLALADQVKAIIAVIEEVSSKWIT